MTITDEESVNSFDGKGGNAAEEKGAAPGDDHNARGFCVSRSLVVVVLLVSAAVVGSLTYTFVKEDEDDDYNRQYEFNVEEIITQSKHNTHTIHTSIKEFAALYPAVATETNTELPFMNIKDFEAFGIATREITTAKLIAYTPLIKNTVDSDEWKDFSVGHANWIVDGHSFYPDSEEKVAQLEPISSAIYRLDNQGDAVLDLTLGPYFPAWQMSPPPTDTEIVNFNYASDAVFAKLAAYITETGESILSEPFDMKNVFGTSAPGSDDGPLSIFLQPVFDSFSPETAIMTGYIAAVIPWVSYFSNLLQEGQNGIVIVVKSCDESHTYELNGPVATYMGPGDLHNPSFNAKVAEFLHDDNSIYEHCHHEMFIYPTSKFKSSSESNDPAIYTSVVVLIFVFAAVVFLLHEWQMRRLHKKVIQQATHSNALVSELFPAGVRDQLISQQSKGGPEKTVADGKVPVKDAKDALMDFVSDQNNSKESSRPIAELFPEATVLFADIAGFTAWSSIREPTQVFTLLESIFQSFDEIAKKYGVFKVETVGDCYVCVMGVPVYSKDHAIVMARFARDCNERVVEVLRGLEMTLGPDTGELAMRFGMHSGPVTAGVLRGDRARFQLFGDTVNTAARVETSGKRGKIHISEQTASYIMAAGKSNWVTLREDVVEAKGKGVLQTYWLHNKTPVKTTSSQTPGSEADDADVQDNTGASLTAAALKKTAENCAQVQDKKIQRLVQWNNELLLQLLKQVVARRHVLHGRKTAPSALTSMAANIGKGCMVVDEVAEIITMPEFDARASKRDSTPATPTSDASTVSDKAMKQLYDYVAVIARLYRNNPFHNFEHASHVTMSVSKLLSRIVAPREENGDEKSQEALLHDHTYGITSDPLTQFAVVLSALIHDVDHRGVPNFLLVKEEEGLATTYNGKSVAEQNSVDIAWATLMSPDYEELRACIFGDICELRRFRQLLVNSIIATDIFDKELGVLRKSRWQKAFHDESTNDGSRTDINRKATIVIEHLIQASDVAHTMQHWHVYQKWNERLFKEMYEAYLCGRSDKDPSIGWYQGEIGFFDHYIIPLAKKLKDCGVFGVSSDEYLNYAMANRREWEAKGENAVEVMKVKHGPKIEDDDNDKLRQLTAEAMSSKAADVLSRFSKN